MLKQVMLASAMIVSAPALAQAQDTTQTTPGRAEVPADPQIMPAQNPAAQPDAAVPTPTTPDQMTEATDPAPPPAQQAAQPATTADQVAQAVDQDFPTYDNNSDGTLDEPEFAAWMTALRTASDPSVKAGSPEMTTWAGQAFASADTDKNATLSKGELTTFLSQGAS